MPGITITTKLPPRTAEAGTTPPCQASASSRQQSPSRPHVSPITPTQESTEFMGSRPAHPAPTTAQSTLPDFAAGRPVFTHTTQTDQVGMTPPPAQPIDFESNPDVLALKSAISILQLQRARATADVQLLSRAKDAALANPEAFTADLVSGRVRMEGDPLTSGRMRSANGGPAENDSESESDSDADSHPADQNGDGTRQQVTPESEFKTDSRTTPTSPTTTTTTTTNGAEGSNQRSHHPSSSSASSLAPGTASAPAWQTLPKPQTVVRCPPINWAQYGVVGESLDKLHAEQVAAPTPGAPMALGQGGAYAFKAGAAAAGGGGGGGGGGEPARRLNGVAAPYNPMKDKVEKKGRGGKR
ncbi:hypothetical protein CHGG_02822 [Chaetomium globosum CBS 148.51]|uniref:Uncharacterized protein n=1 Tax=Chaetomium globosum (strain ATCC 6205 / CBS 148.51 / DSM 1962 / NBRC 6347 / NRRL 1970) TaxID=306901 RepID=Q2HAD2_CHAGB|nr:uncharacterized protein CHGG_02822 [Chaetomium globosum CBS 148.51]EAQ90887.1 hypothetical protein CHGG_02822 [Chaetomium globosum CBS 148.51]